MDLNQHKFAVDFLWLELTNVCNLSCKHCYSGSSPFSTSKDILTGEDYKKIMREASEIGCKQVQFIGGEPTVNRDIVDLLNYALELGYEFVEIFSNLMRIPEPLYDAIVANKDRVFIATSIYSHDHETHDEITERRGSWFNTIRNLDKFLHAGVECRAAFVEMGQNKGHYENTLSFVKSRGLHNFSFDEVRELGRAALEEEKMSELCGECAGKTLRVGPDGQISPCIMSSEWSAGNFLTSGLKKTVLSEKMSSIRADIFEATRAKREAAYSREQANACTPCNPYCSPGQQCNPCPPNTNCGPNCAPTGYR